MRKPIVRTLYFATLTFLCITGCNQNDDAAMLYSYPKYGLCSIDSPARGETIIIEKELLVRGWAYDEKRKIVPETLTMYFIHEETNAITVVTVKRDEKREDVAKALNNPILIDSGFGGTVAKSKLTAGKYQLILLQADRTAGAISCAGEPHKVTLL